ncbi:MAG: hypothetical protein KA712_03780 [Myxococcales bacterium]|nr:hypothetical protein [Myxococcales bacterium]
MSYFVLQARTPVDDEGGYYDIGDGIELDGVRSWALGVPITASLATPLVVPLTPIEGFTGDVPALADGYLCLMSHPLVEALRAAGVDNLQTFDAVLVDETHGRTFAYQAVNIIGMVAAADLQASQWENLDGPAKMDTHFDELKIDPDRALGLLLFRLAENTGIIVVHERIKKALEAAGIPTLVFLPA